MRLTSNNFVFCQKITPIEKLSESLVIRQRAQ